MYNIYCHIYLIKVSRKTSLKIYQTTIASYKKYAQRTNGRSGFFICSKVLEETSYETKAKSPKVYSKELIDIFFERPYCKSEILTTRMKISRITAANI